MSTLKVNPVMYLISDPRVEMSKGKFAAQAAHAAVQAYKVSPDDRLKHIWDECGQQYAKVVLQTDDLHNATLYILQRGFKVVPILDEGRTEFDADLTLTFLGVQIVDKNRADVQATFGGFKLYKEHQPVRLQDAVERQRQLHPELYEEKRSFIHRCKERISAHRPRRGS